MKNETTPIMTDTFRTLCAELSFIWNRSTNPDDLFENMIPLVDRARAALAKPTPSLKEQALAELAATERCHPADYSTIRRALEQLND
jgi:DNA-binding MarR family transcriptional regulator